jgi:hypothetical protein
MENIDLKGHLAYFDINKKEWCPLTMECLSAIDSEAEANGESSKRINESIERLQSILSSSLKLPNLSFFAGSGTSLGQVGGPSMRELWDKSMLIDHEAAPGDDNYGVLHQSAIEVMDKVRYQETENPNIEHFLSHCESYLQVEEEQSVLDYVRDVKETILFECSDFLEKDESDISPYKMLLQKLARRRVRDPRLKVFTTNYDMCFETAASELGMMVIDGFSYSRNRQFNGLFFNYDVVRREEDSHEFVEGVFKLYKLHGSVSWKRDGSSILESTNIAPDDAALIYPAKGKYQQAFVQPYFELLSRYLESLREANSCLIIAGFGFNDDHLSEPILSAITSNPSLKLIIADFGAYDHISNSVENDSSPYWSKLFSLARSGYDIHFVNGSFSEFASLIPNLKAITPAEQLVSVLKQNGLR